jgi:hypothetical protein
MRLALLLLASPGWCWQSHHTITHLALSGEGLDQATLAYEPLDDYLTAVGQTRDGFLRANKLNPTSPLWNQAGEAPGAKLSMLKVLETYSDEPDQTMDGDIFTHYPELWKDQYTYMGGKIPGEANRAWRHMYWPGGYMKPDGSGSAAQDPTPIGEAPSRSKLCYDLALAAFRSGHPYWGARFFAWSLHYVQDVTQPFHAAQLPSMRFMRFGEGFKPDVEATVRVIAYYHFGIESIAARLLDGRLPGPRSKLASAIASKAAGTCSPDPLVRGAAAEAAAKAKELANDALKLFPPTPAELKDFDPVAAIDAQSFWDQVGAGLPSAESGAPFVDLLADLLGDAGAATRSLVKQAKTQSSPGPAL